MGYDLDLMKTISRQFDYDDRGPKPLTEEHFDDFETAYETLKYGVELEFKAFLAHLLDDDSNVEKFLWSFVAPSTESFQDSFEHVLNKFTARDERTREQFLNRVKVLFRNLFIEKLQLGDEETSLRLADKYYTVFKTAIEQHINKMKSKEGQSIPTAQEVQTGDIDYR